MTNLARPIQIFLWSYVFIYAVFSSLSITQVDLWWQLTEGERILHMWTLPTQPAVAFGLPATPYFDEYAGYEVVLALLYHLTGFIGLWMVFAAIYLAILFLPGATTVRKYPAFDLASTLALLAATLLLRARLEQRPELVGGFLQVLLMVLLRASDLEKITPRTFVWLFLLFLVWTNVHSTFVFGFFTLGLWIASELLTRFRSTPITILLLRGAALAALALFATILNPYGPQRLLFPFLQAYDPGSTALSPEMWPITYFSTALGAFLLIALVLLVWGLLSTQRLPLWLMIFSVFSIVIAFRSFRFIDLIAISLLFVYAARNDQAEAKPSTLPLLLALPRDLALCLLCLFLLFLDAFNLLSNYFELRSELRPATHGLRYASDMAAYSLGIEGRRVPVICGHGMGSYLSFQGNGNFRPLLDSGLAHFSSDTKRYFFFAWLEPDALGLALDQLHVNYALLDLDTFPWIPTLHRLPDWQFVTCSANGMIWKRNPDGPHPLSAGDRAQVASSIRSLEENGNLIGAFAYSTLLDCPKDSLAILARYHGLPWNEPFFNSFSAWADSLAPTDIHDFLAKNSCEQCPLLGALLSARLGPEAYDTFIVSHSKDPGVWYWKAIATQVLVQKGDVTGARRVFESIRPVPSASTAYYLLWHEVEAQDGHGHKLSIYGQWQTWNADGKIFISTMSMRLNERLAKLAPPP